MIRTTSWMNIKSMMWSETTRQKITPSVGFLFIKRSRTDKTFNKVIKIRTEVVAWGGVEAGIDWEGT